MCTLRHSMWSLASLLLTKDVMAFGECLRCAVWSQVPNPSGLVAAQQPAAISQLVALPSAQQQIPAAAAPPLPQLSVHTSLKLPTPSLQPDLSTQLLAVSRPATALPDLAVRQDHSCHRALLNSNRVVGLNFCMGCIKQYSGSGYGPAPAANVIVPSCPLLLHQFPCCVALCSGQSCPLQK